MIERMDEALRPAVQYAVSVLSEHWPRLSFAAVNFDEIFGLVMGGVQSYYLRTADALQAESFYGFKRMHVDKISGAGAAGGVGEHGLGGGDARHAKALDPAARARALICAVVAPYLLKKAHDWYEREAGAMSPLGVRERPPRVPSPPARSNTIARAWWWARRYTLETALYAFPLAHITHQLACFATQIAFLLGKTSFHSPYGWLIQQSLCRLTEEDTKALADAETRGRSEALKRASRSRWRVVGLLRSMALRLLWVGLDWAKYALVGAILLFKGIEWWYGSEVQAQRQQPAAFVPPPPPPPRSHREGLGLPIDPTLCPFTGERCHNPACSVSGYVFSYAPLHEFVRRHKCCPVTRAPMTVNDIRRLFVQST